MPLIPSRTQGIAPFWQTTDKESVKLFLGDVIEVLRKLPEKSVQLCVTSPPYWGLRSYLQDGHKDKGVEIGSEDTPQEFVQKMVEVFREVRRVLRDDGTLFLNLGDSYSGGSGGNATNSEKQKSNQGTMIPPSKGYKGLKSGNLVGIPWRVALALQEDGWILRSDIPWVKRSPMPESVCNRPAKALEYVFMFSKVSSGYFWDGDAIKKKAMPEHFSRYKSEFNTGEKESRGAGRPGAQCNTAGIKPISERRNFWQADLWFESVDTPHGLTRVDDEIVGIDCTSQGYDGAHFATFPRKLIEPFIKAGTSEKGCCAKCGTPWKRVLEEKKLTRERLNDYAKRRKDAVLDVPGNPMYRGGPHNSGLEAMNTCSNSVAGVETRTVGWKPTCSCGIEEAKPCIVLDPFIGSGTSCVCALRLGRSSWGIDLSEDYLRKNAIVRIEGALLGLGKAELTGREVKRIEGRSAVKR